MIGLHRAAHTCARGDVIEDHRDIRCIGDGGKMAHKPALRGLVVVRRDGEQRVDARALCGFGECDGGGGAVCAAARDDRDAMVHGAHAALNERHALIEAQRRGLAGRAADDDGVGAAAELPFDKTFEGGKIHRAVPKGGDDGHGAAGKYGCFHKTTPFSKDPAADGSCRRSKRYGTCLKVEENCRIM